MIERWLEVFLFQSRWLLAPFYIALVIGISGLLLKSIQELFYFVVHLPYASEPEVILGVLSLVDITLTGSLVLIVILSGYENFVSKIDVAGHEDRPEWISTIGFSGLKLKLMSTIVAISAIQLLKAFMNIKDVSDRDILWYVIIHMVFVVSGLLFAWSDRIGDQKKS